MPEPDITVRLTHPRDREAVLALLRTGNAEHRAAMPPDLFDDWMDNLLALETREGDAETWIATVDGRPAGCVAFFATGARERFGAAAAEARIRALAVHPDARGRGIGSRLLQRCVERARALGAPALSLHTAEFMTAAKRLYERYGFERVPRDDVDAARVLGIGLDSPVSLPVIAYSLAIG